MLAIIAGLIALYFVLVRPAYNYFRHAANARRLHCKPPHSRVNKLPLGIDYIRRLNAADKRDMIPEEVNTIFEEQGTFSFQHWIGGKRQLFTVEPRNLQALLATQFTDFETSAAREGSFAPLLGQGIFTANGPAW